VLRESGGHTLVTGISLSLFGCNFSVISNLFLKSYPNQDKRKWWWYVVLGGLTVIGCRYQTTTKLINYTVMNSYVMLDV
jgi:hypothetical protein